MHVEAGIQRSLLDSFEQRHDLFAFRVDGWSAWRVMRNPVHRQIEALPIAQPARSDVFRSIRAILETFKLVAILVRGRRRELLVKTCRSGLRVSIGAQFRDVYFDGLLERGYSFLKLEEVNSRDFDRQATAARYPSDLDPVVFTFWGMVLSLIAPVRSARRFCVELARLLNNEYGIAVTPGWLNLRVSTAYWQSRLYGLLLRRTRPRAVLVSDTGEYAVCLACKRLGIRFIELQHGVFEATHPDAVPRHVRGSSFELLLPDVLACRGVFWVEKLAQTRQGKDHAVVVGNELIDAARTRRAEVERDGQKHVVVSTQGLDTMRFAKWLEQVVETAPVGLDWEMAVKFHPIYDTDTTAFAALSENPRVRLIGGGDQPNIFDLLVNADLHVSIASACHYDAAALGVPTVVAPLSGHELMLSAVDGAYVHLARAPVDVWEILKLPLGSAEQAYRFSAPGFIENLSRLIPRSNHVAAS